MIRFVGQLVGGVLLLLSVVSPLLADHSLSHWDNNDCKIGVVQLNKRFDYFDLFNPTLFPERAHPDAQGYIALDAYDRHLMGQWFLFKWANEGEWRLVRVASARQWKHQDMHDEIWGDTWLAEVDEDTWGDRSYRGHMATLCRAPIYGSNTLRRLVVPFMNHQSEP